MPINSEKMARLPSREVMQSLLAYDPDTGTLTWKARDFPLGWSVRWAGKPALNCIGDNGYLRGRLLGRYVYAHRVIFKLMMDFEPPQIDHNDGCRTNNRWGNLYAATAVDNARNAIMKASNRSGRTGVHRGASGKWIAQIRRGPGHHVHLGSFDDFHEACAIREKAEHEIGFRVREVT